MHYRANNKDGSGAISVLAYRKYNRETGYSKAVFVGSIKDGEFFPSEKNPITDAERDEIATKIQSLAREAKAKKREIAFGNLLETMRDAEQFLGANRRLIDETFARGFYEACGKIDWLLKTKGYTKGAVKKLDKHKEEVTQSEKKEVTQSDQKGDKPSNKKEVK